MRPLAQHFAAILVVPIAFWMYVVGPFAGTVFLFGPVIAALLLRPSYFDIPRPSPVRP